MNNLDFKQFQEWTKEADRKRGAATGKEVVYPIMNHMVSEVGEVAECINRLTGWKDKPETEEHLAEEISDIIVLAFKLANCFDIDMDEAMKKVIKKLEGRWNLGVDKY